MVEYTEEAMRDYARKVVGKRFHGGGSLANGWVRRAWYDGRCVMGYIEGDDGSTFEVRLLCGVTK